MQQHSDVPKPQRVRLAGTVDDVRQNDGAFSLVLRSGEKLPIVLVKGDVGALPGFLGTVAVVSGVAWFLPSGSLLRVHADQLQPATDQDLAFWSEAPRPVFAGTDSHDLRRPQGPTSGINAVIGTWPGDETDDEIFEMLEEIS